MLDVGRHPNIELMAYSELKGLEGDAGNFTAKVLKKARYVDADKCTGCRCLCRGLPYARV